MPCSAVEIDQTVGCYRRYGRARLTPVKLDGKVAVVTGGGSGMGYATAHRLARSGVRVVIADLDEAAGRAAARDVGGSCVPMDVSKPGDWTRLMEELEREHGGVDIAHLNAGVGTIGGPPERRWDGDIATLTDEQYRRAMGANIDGVVFGMRAVVPSMRRRGGGAIVATVSLAGLMAWPPDSIYTASKHAAVGFVRSAAPPLEADHITVNAVCPGMVDTPLVPAMFGTDATERLGAAGFPLLSPDDVAVAVVDLMMGSATGNIVVLQPGREPEPFRFGRVPGPRSTNGTSIRPPAEMGSGQ